MRGKQRDEESWLGRSRGRGGGDGRGGERGEEGLMRGGVEE